MLPGPTMAARVLVVAELPVVELRAISASSPQALGRDRGALGERGLSSRIVLQVHDEILVEAVAAERDEVLALTVETMEHAFELRVPMAVHVAIGDSWAAGKEPALDAGAEFDGSDSLAQGEPIV